MILKDICRAVEEIAPLHAQEEWDNSGLIVGDPSQEVKSAMVCFDVTPDVLDEAIKTQTDLIISHHPMIFKGIKRFTGQNETERLVVKAIQNGIAIYAAHTSLDNAPNGVNALFAQQLGLQNCTILAPKNDALHKLVVFTPSTHTKIIREALFAVGAGHIGNYDKCSFSTSGEGTFRGNEESNPFVGERGTLHREQEERIEVVVPQHLLSSTIKAMQQAHPYEEVAFDIIPLKNSWNSFGAGVIGELTQPMAAREFLNFVKKQLGSEVLKCSEIVPISIKKVALCGGSGAFLLGAAKAQGADIFITGDLKYHDFQGVEKKMIIVDAGHYETEAFCTSLIIDHLIKSFTTFAVRRFERQSNMISYL